jgi:hypothetical protein
MSLILLLQKTESDENAFAYFVSLLDFSLFACYPIVVAFRYSSAHGQQHFQKAIYEKKRILTATIDRKTTLADFFNHERIFCFLSGFL